MKRSARPSLTIDNHSESFHQRLNAYALAAGAAGVSLLALAPPSEAKIIHRHLGVAVQGNDNYPFNPANQGVAFEFLGSFINRTSAWWNRVWLRPNSQYAGALLAKNAFAADLAPGAVIGHGGAFGEGASSGLLFTYGPYGGGTRKNHKGNFAFERTDYLGFKFNIAGKTHFGWLRVKITIHPFQGEMQTVAVLRDYAYETIPGKSIRAGQTAKGDSPVSGNPRGASLGALALGAAGIPLWRQERVTATQ